MFNSGKVLYRNSTFLLLLLVSATLLSACSRDPEVRKQGYYDSGMEYLEQGKLSEATIQFRNALQVDPAFVEARTMLGNLWFRQRQYREAYRELHSVVEARPDYLPARKAMGSFYLASRMFSEAQEEAEYALEASPDD
ncbi:MAG: tetratricopeptide repeat protein, partial [candidate division Zixibacteria bacterium]|nr:tetratricopeptide repeat protein [candidate division Zixibacteria bacterium]